LYVVTDDIANVKVNERDAQVTRCQTQEIRNRVVEWKIEGSGPSVELITSERATDTIQANSSNSHFLEQVTVIERYKQGLKTEVMAIFLIGSTKYALRRNVVTTFLICCTK
jgi:homoserine kinase